MKTIINIWAVVCLLGSVPAFAQRTAAEYLRQCEASSEKGDDAKAVGLCTRAIELDPTLDEAYLTRALVYKCQGNIDAAISDQTKLIELTGGFVQFLVYRAELYLLQSKYEPALLDLNTAIGKQPKGLFGARAYYMRGTIYEARANLSQAIADYRAALVLRPGYPKAAVRLATIRPVPSPPPPVTPKPTPKPTPTPLPTRPVTPLPPVPLATSTPVPVSGGWKLMELTGTALSVESPQPFLLKQDKPDPFIEKQTANVFWTLSSGGLFANVRYVRSSDNKTPRQELESLAKLVAGANNTPVAKVIDTTFLGQPAVKFEEDFVDTYDSNKVRRHRQVIAFGPPGEVTTIHISYPLLDIALTATGRQLLGTFKKQGAAVAATPKEPPANWKYVTFHGLQVETPDQTPRPKCGIDIPSIQLIEQASACYEWDSSPILQVDYKRYRSNAAVPTVAQMALQEISLRRDLAKESTLKTRDDYSTEPIVITGAEAVKVKVYTGYGTTGTGQEIIYIKRGAEVWKVRTTESVRWQYTADAVKRIISSLRLAT